MTGDSGNRPPAKPVSLADRRLRSEREARKAMAEHLAQGRAVDERTQKLRALRLAREAANAAPAPKPKRTRKPPPA